MNDSFVMNSWKENQEAENIHVIPDGNGTFTEGMGMLVDKSAIGFGKRSWRYSMVVNNKVVEKMFIEPNKVERHKSILSILSITVFLKCIPCICLIYRKVIHLK